MHSSIIAAVLFAFVFNAGDACALDLSGAAFEQPVLAPSASERMPFSSGLLGEDVLLPGEDKSTSKAVLYSLLLPGLGQLYLGEKQQATFFLTLDALIWTSFIVFTVQADLREDEYQQYAQTFARVTRVGHSDEYYGILTQHDSFLGYENELKSEGRLLFYPDVDTALLDQYFVENRVSDYEPWVWRSAEHRRAYQDRRSASKRADRRALYSLAAALANRVAAAFFAYRSAAGPKQEEKVQQSEFSIELGAPQRQVSAGFQTGISLIRNF